MKKILALLMLSDVFVLTGFGLISPILAIFIKDNLVGGTIAAAGLASMIFIITRAGLQLIFSKVFNPKDRVWMIIGGTFVIATIPFIYAFSTHITHIYLAQLLYGIGGSLAYPSWFSLFASNLDKGQEGFEWSIYTTCEGLGSAFAAYAGAILAQQIGFKIVFFITGALSILGMIILFGLEKKQRIRKNILDRKHKLIRHGFGHRTH